MGSGYFLDWPFSQQPNMWLTDKGYTPLVEKKEDPGIKYGLRKMT